MRCLPVLSLLIAIHLVVASIDDEDSPNDIPYKDPAEDNDDDDSEDVLILRENSKLEEIMLRSMSKYIRFWNENPRDDESDSDIPNKGAFKRNKTDLPPKSSPSKSFVRRKREANADQQTIICNATSKYRTIDGTCNNLKHPKWGMAMGCQERLLPANYRGYSCFRESVKGGPLPEARNLSLNINTNESHPEMKRSHLYMFFGQFCAHDMVLTALFSNANGGFLACCQPELKEDARCENIHLPKDDPFFGQFNRSCMDFARAVSCGTCSCDKKGRKLLNMNTAALDLSLVYGSSENVSKSLTANDGTGKLLSQNTSQGELLPNSSNPATDGCSDPNMDKICFRAGDVRVNQHVVITSLQTIFLRLHNIIASKLKGLNPLWDDERLYQETRRICIAMYQVVVYKEYLPTVLCTEEIDKYGLGLSANFTKYDHKSMMTIFVECAAAAFRVPHSSINTAVSTEPRPVTDGNEKLRDLFACPFGLRKGPLAPLMEDTTKIPSQMSDRHEVEDVTNFLYRRKGAPFGLDLASLDIQRGRDTGLPTYVEMVKYCSNKTITDYDNITSFGLMDAENVELLRKNYESVLDVDLETAMLMEKKANCSIFGPTSACIIGIQFKRLKFADRFFVTHENQTGSFTEDQLKELVKASLTLVICKTCNGTTALPKNAQLLESPENPLVNCEDLQDLNFTKWKE